MTQIEFEKTLIALRPDMVKVALAFFHNDEYAQDVVQEVYVRLLQRGWHDGDDLEALAIRATKNLCVSVWRHQQLRETEPLDGIPDVAERETADAPLLHEERCQKIEQAIQHLPPTEQKLIRMRLQENMSLKEISQHTGMSSRSASTMLSSAKKRLLTLIKDKDR